MSQTYHQEQPIHQLWWRSLTEDQKESRIETFKKMSRLHSVLSLYSTYNTDEPDTQYIFDFFKREESPFLGRLVSYKPVFDHETLEWEIVVSRIVSYKKLFFTLSDGTIIDSDHLTILPEKNLTLKREGECTTALEKILTEYFKENNILTVYCHSSTNSDSLTQVIYTLDAESPFREGESTTMIGTFRSLELSYEGEGIHINILVRLTNGDKVYCSLLEMYGI